MRSFEAPNPALFFKTGREHDTRIGELVRPIPEKSIEKMKPGYVLYGYPDDEGIRINHGRVGSREAPDAIRAAFYKLTPGRRDFPRVFDLGNLSLEGNLRERHERAAVTVTEILQHGHSALAMGGGHDYGFADGHGFLSYFENVKGTAKPTSGKSSAVSKRPLILNFDAHLDVRPDSDGPNSGSAFYRLIETHKNFDLVEVGLQLHCNSLQHRHWALERGVKILDLKDIQGRLLESLEPVMKVRRPTFLSLDIDAFSSAFAPGASASYATGLDPNEFAPVLRALTAALDIRVFGIYEVSPPLDFSNKTSQLAAILFHTFLNAGA